MSSKDHQNAKSAEIFVKDSLENLKQSGGLFERQTVIPGDDVTEYVVTTTTEKAILIGTGLEEVSSESKCNVVVGTAGILCAGPMNSFSVEGTSKRYFPKVDDQVVGIIEEKGGDYYQVNCFSGRTFLLNRLAFEGATKRNKPDLNRGDIVYARVINADKFSDPELTCATKNGPKKEWTTGETIFGELSQGLIIRIQTERAKKMLLPDCVVLNALGKYFAFEVAVGVNGAVWLRGTNDVETVVIRNAILNAEILDDAQAVAMVDKLAALSKKMLKRKAEAL